MTDLTIDRIICLFSLAVLCGFLGILFGFVTRWDLGIIIAVTLGLVVWDFWATVGRRGKDS